MPLPLIVVVVDSPPPPQDVSNTNRNSATKRPMILAMRDLPKAD
jgi:hypothetical protein